MIKATPNEVLNQALLLEDGGQITIPFTIFEQAERFRLQLYKTRKVLEKRNKTLAYQLYISREATKEGWNVIVSRELSVPGIFITSPDGSVRPFERAEAGVEEGENDTGRMVRLMREDGMTEEAIADLLAERGEEDFDKAASKIEALQEKDEAEQEAEEKAEKTKVDPKILKKQLEEVNKKGGKE